MTETISEDAMALARKTVRTKFNMRKIVDPEAYALRIAEAIMEDRASRPAAAPQQSTTDAEPVAWVPEDELPESLPESAYDALYPHSRVDVIRWFPVYAAPQAKAGTEKLVEALKADLCRAVSLVEAILTNDPTEPIDDAGHVALDAWQYELESLRAAIAKHGGRS